MSRNSDVRANYSRTYVRPTGFFFFLVVSRDKTRAYIKLCARYTILYACDLRVTIAEKRGDLGIGERRDAWARVPRAVGGIYAHQVGGGGGEITKTILTPGELIVVYY